MVGVHKKVRKDSPLSCPKYGIEMRIISFINKTSVIRKILEHLELWGNKKTLELTPPDLILEKSYEPYDNG